MDNKYFTYYDILLLADAGLLMESDVLITVRVSPHARGYVYQNNRVFFEFQNESELKIDNSKSYFNPIISLSVDNNNRKILIAFHFCQSVFKIFFYKFK